MSATHDDAAGPASRVRAWCRAALRFGNGVLGADKYERYVAHHRASGAPGEPLSEREFWRDYQKWQDENPQGRCC